MIMGSYAINMQEEVATATKVKWWVMDDVVAVMGIVLEWPVRCHWILRE
jgi:hypothetical protein